METVCPHLMARYGCGKMVRDCFGVARHGDARQGQAGQGGGVQLVALLPAKQTWKGKWKWKWKWKVQF